MIPPRILRLKDILACPYCQNSPLDFHPDAAVCGNCRANYPIKNNRIFFVSSAERSDNLDIVKGWLKKRLGQAYYKIGVDIIAPTYPFRYAHWIRRYLNPGNQIVIDIGCGNHRIDDDIIGMDLFEYDAVDIVCDLKNLPFIDGRVDAFVSRSVLEHLPDPLGVIQQLYRCTRIGGYGLHLAPFLFPFHASPYDFHRFTHKGFELLFKDWELVKQINATGPVTLGLISLIEFLSILFGFGHNRYKAIIYLFFCGLLFPFKFLDAPFINRQSFLSLAPTIFNIIQKNNATPS